MILAQAVFREAISRLPSTSFFHICDMFMIRKYTHHLMSCKGMSENFEMNLFCSKIKKFGLFMESVWNLHLYSKSELIVTF